MTVCSIAGCERAVRTRGWCSLHYHRWLRHGDPLVATVKVIGGWGHSGDPLRITWHGMKARCTPSRKKDRTYQHYAGKGICVCPEWVDDFDAFKSWSLSHGYFYGCGLTLDRVDGNGNYSPVNCRWTTWIEQGRNTSRVPPQSAWGESKSIAAWADNPRCAVSYEVLRLRFKRGWPLTEALTTAKGSYPTGGRWWRREGKRLNG